MDRVINVWEHCDVNQFGIVALQAAYSDEGAAWLEEMNAVVRSNFLLLRDLFAERFPSVRVPELEATYLLWLDFESAMVTSPDAISAHRCSGRGPSQMGGAARPARGEDTIADFLLEHHQVRVSDGAIYGGPEGIRLNLACPEATMKEGLRRIAEGLSELF